MKKRSEACISVMVRFRDSAPRTSTFVEVEEKHRIDRARGYEAADSASLCLNLQIVIQVVRFLKINLNKNIPSFYQTSSQENTPSTHPA